MLSLQLETKPAQDIVAGMIEQINHFKRVDVGTVLSEFQTGDMHRNRPFTMRSRAKGMAKTIVRPHSRFEMLRSLYAQKGQARLLRLLAKPRKRAYRGQLGIYKTYRRWSTRPILRSEMFEDLSRRASDALDQIKWKK